MSAQELGADGAPRLLLAEDNPLNQRILVAILCKFGWEVDVAENGRRAVEMASATPYDLVLMDVLMPEMDGIAALEKIRAFEGDAGQVPIVAITAHTREDDKAHFLSLGFDGYVGKPIHVQELVSVVGRCLVAAKRTATMANGA